MRHLKYFEDIEEEPKPKYPYKDIGFFIEWLHLTYGDRMKNEGWTTIISDRDVGYDHYNTDGDFWEVEDDTDSDAYWEAVKHAKELGIMLDSFGFIVGFDNVFFLDHPEAIEVYRKQLPNLRITKRFDL